MTDQSLMICRSDLSCPRPSTRDFAQIVNAPVDRLATSNTSYAITITTTPPRPMPVFDIAESQPSGPQEKAGFERGTGPIQACLCAMLIENVDAYFGAQESNITDAG